MTAPAATRPTSAKRDSTGPAYRPLTAAVIRAPLLPASDYHGFATAIDGVDRSWADPAFRFAVSVASPDLAQALSVPGGPAGASARARAALQRYLIRACVRPTPFGGFAAVAIGHWADHTSVQIAPDGWPTRSRPDMAWLTAVAEQLASDPGGLPGLRVFTNTCALDRDGRIYLSDPGTGGAAGAPDLSVRASAVVRSVLARARCGAALAELGQHILAGTPGATPEKTDRLLAELCQNRLLVPELLPALTADPLAHLTGQLARLPAAADLAAQLGRIGADCRTLDTSGPEEAAAMLPSVREQMNDLTAVLGPGQPAGAAAAVSVDSALPLLGSGITRDIAADVARSVDVLLRLHPCPSADALAPYRDAFHRRYGDGRRVPLLELLDPRFGLGPPPPGPATPPDHHRAGLLQSLLAASMRDGFSEVVLGQDQIERLSTWVPDPRRLPSSLELSVFVAARSRGAIDRGEYRLVVGPNLGAAAAGRGLGRFADLLGAAAQDLLREAAEAEQDRSGPIAELVYRPVRPRAGNVAIRPVVRSLELPVGVAPSLPPDAVVAVDELSVVLRDGRLRLWWGRAGCELGLAAGHMLNPAAAPPLCRQLMELAGDGVVSLTAFDWGPLSMMPFLPRVRTGRVVLHPARWRLTAPGDSDFSGPGLDALLEDWRARWQLPRHAYLTQADNRLLLDLDHAGHRDQLRAALKRSRQRVAVLQEALPGPEDAWLPGPRGRHVVELVVPLVLDQRRTGPNGRGDPRPAAGQEARTAPRWPDADRSRPPGSDWLYLILTGPRATEDGLLAGSLGELADRLVEQGHGDGWFFVRYADPEPQLRMRVHGAAAALTGQVLPALAQWSAQAIAAGLRTRLSLETYERELERYGGPEATRLCELIACADSHAVRMLLGAAVPDRLDLALVSTADLLASLASDPAGLAPRGRDAARSGAVYRERRAQLRMLVTAVRDSTAEAAAPWSAAQWQAVRGAVADRRQTLAPLVARLRDVCGEGTSSCTFAELVPSLLHLHANRLGLSRSDEQLMFGLIDRTTRSIRAHP